MKLLVKLYLTELIKENITIEDVPNKLREEVQTEYDKINIDK